MLDGSGTGLAAVTAAVRRCERDAGQLMPVAAQTERLEVLEGANAVIAAVEVE
jgi:hypothetical protein